MPMFSPIAGSTPGLVGNWRLDEGNGDIIIDNSVSGNDGVIANVVWVEGKALDPVAINEHNSIETPKEFLLSKAYPNPFNGQTVIRYYLDKQSTISIDIFDILGSKVCTIRKKIQPAGHHRMIWDARDLSSGVYFYKLQAGEYSEIMKMVLIK